MGHCLCAFALALTNCALLCRLAAHCEQTERIGKENSDLRAQIAAVHEAASKSLDMYKVLRSSCLSSCIPLHVCAHVMAQC